MCAPPSSFHNKLKCNPRYLDHKVNHRLDDLIHVLLKVERDLFLSQKTKEVGYIHTFSLKVSQACTMQVMKTAADASELQEGDRHRKGLDLDNATVQVVKIASL